MVNKITNWFTLGQNHVHRINGFTYDCDVVVEITAENPSDEMVKLFNDKWAFHYNNLPKIEYFPRGIKKINI